MTPDKIYIQPNAHDGWFEGNKPNENFTEYIRKDALREWVEEKKNELLSCEPSGIAAGINGGLDMIISKLNSM